jgi:hypothetical protein
MSEESQETKCNRDLNLWLVAAAISFLFSVVLWFGVDKQAGIFVGLWVPSILSLSATLRTQR